ncbi:LOW QUALITY PROTEIN: ZNF345 isoform 2, partial [Pongo abelii]
MENLTKHSIECSSFRDPQALPETQLCVSSSYSLRSSTCKAISMPRQGLSWRA